MDSCTVDLGHVRAGIRANTEGAAAALRRALAPIEVDDPLAPKNFSLAFSRNPTDAHLLFWGGCVAARSFDPDRVVRSLVDHLSAHRPPPEGLVWVTSIPFVGPAGTAVLMPDRYNDDLRIVDRRLRQEGWVPVDAPRALVDLATGELVVADLVEYDREALAAVSEGALRRRAEATVPRGRYPIERWVFVDYTGGWGPIGRGLATRAAVLEIVEGIDHPDVEVVETVSALFTKVAARSMYPGHRSAMVDAVLDRTPDLSR
ncbi:MAG TPA: hypothetical protein VFJ85_01750 [Acidimicrobiales bacterium]|nr:hypothetical protein [Acidimicrobiales bacterium]